MDSTRHFTCLHLLTFEISLQHSFYPLGLTGYTDIGVKMFPVSNLHPQGSEVQRTAEPGRPAPPSGAKGPARSSNPCSQVYVRYFILKSGLCLAVNQSK